jgi:hypothetical protein
MAILWQTIAMKPKAASKRKKTTIITRGNVVLRIRHGEQLIAGKTYPLYTFAYRLGGEPVRRRRLADFEEAKREAEMVATKLANQEQEALKLSPADRTCYVQARDFLKPTNTPLNIAAAEYAHAVKSLPPGVTMREVVSFYLKRNPTCFPKRTVSEVVEELLQAKEKAGRSELHLRDLESRLGRFSDAVQMKIGDVTGAVIEEYIQSLNVKGRTKGNYLIAISNLINFAIRRKYLPKDAIEEVKAVERPEAPALPA